MKIHIHVRDGITCQDGGVRRFIVTPSPRYTNKIVYSTPLMIRRPYYEYITTRGPPAHDSTFVHLNHSRAA